jgi:hypothetical protein
MHTLHPHPRNIARQRLSFYTGLCIALCLSLLVSLNMLVFPSSAQTETVIPTEAVIPTKTVTPKKQRIAILDFQNKGGVSAEEASIISQRVRAYLSQSDNYDILERQEIQALLKEQGFQQSLYTQCEEDCADRLGKLLNVDALVMGGVSHLGQLYVISARLVDLEKGTIVKEVFQDCVCELQTVLATSTHAIAQQLLPGQKIALQQSLLALPGMSASPNNESKRTGYVTQTFAGNGWGGYRDGERLQSQLQEPHAIVQLPNGAWIIADTKNQVLRQLQGNTLQPYSGGRWNLLLGEVFNAFADGPAKVARFHAPSALAVSAQGIVYVADTDNHRIRKVLPDGQVVTFVGTGQPGYADGNAAVAQFRRPQGLALDPDGTLYVADTDNHAIRKVSPHGEVSTLAGGQGAGFEDGHLARARFRFPTAMVLGLHRNRSTLFIADTHNHALRSLTLPQHQRTGRLTTGSAQVHTLAGNGENGFVDAKGVQSRWRAPQGLCLMDNTLYVADTDNHRIRSVSLSDTTVTTLVGTGAAGFQEGNAAVGQFNHPTGLACDTKNQRLLVADRGNHRIREVRIPL